jgi:lysophospholipase L1-like esterase
MSARGRLLSVLVTIVIALAGFVGLGALPAAATPPIIPYVALGDSYAAGQGAPPYLNPCLQTNQSYPSLLDLESRIQLLQPNTTCTGLTTSDVADIVEDLIVLNDDTRLVTLTVGAADLDLSRVLTACTAVPPVDCEDAINDALALLAVPPGGESVLGGRLTDLYADVAGRAPRARVMVTGYPLLFSPAPTDPNLTLKLQINAATAALNSTIEQAVSVANDADVNIHYVDVTEAFAGHGIGGEPEFINPLCDFPCDPIELLGAFHPTAAGYQAYADAIAAALPGGWFDKQKQSV